MITDAIHTRHWTRADYSQMAEAGVFHPDEHVELINGEILTRTPQRSQHAALMSIVDEHLRAAFGPDYLIRVQMPIALGDDSEPEPDLAIVPGRPHAYLTHHPTTALLIVEIADTTLNYDRQTKARLYATYHIPEYWILNVQEEHLEMYRAPEHGTYQTTRIYQRGETICPLHANQATVTITDLLPPLTIATFPTIQKL